MASVPGSSSRPHGPQEGDWQSCSISHLQLSRLQTQGYLPPPDLVSVRAGLTTIGADALAENFPNPSQGERVCFTSFLLRGVGFPIHPFLRGLLEHYGIQLHNLTPGSILHISCFVALCELFLVTRLTSSYGKSSSASSPAIRVVGLFLKWAAPKYGA